MNDKNIFIEFNINPYPMNIHVTFSQPLNMSIDLTENISNKIIVFALSGVNSHNTGKILQVLIEPYNICNGLSYFQHIPHKGVWWPCSYGSWIYNYLCNQCLSPLML